MDRIKLAERQYERIAPNAGAAWPDVSREKILVWLSDYVCPVIEEYIGNQRFQEYASWSVRILASPSLSPLASLIRDVDHALVAAAKALQTLAQDKAIGKQIRIQNPPQKKFKEIVRISTVQSRQLIPVKGVVDHLAIKEAWVHRIANHQYANLVCSADYFRPEVGIIPPKEMTEIRKQKNSAITDGAMVASLNPELHLVGDFITRCMFHRIKILMDCLNDYRRVCFLAIRAAGSKATAVIEVEEQAWSHLKKKVIALRTACLTDRDAKIRDSCITLVQVYAAFYPNPELSWLGVPKRLITNGTAFLKYSVTSNSFLEALDRISLALLDLRDIQDRIDGQVEMAIQGGGLVLIAEPRVVYWNKDEIFKPWEKHIMPWDLLWKLADKALLGGVVQDKDIYDKRGCKNRLSNLKGNLLKLLPRSLSQLIKSVHSIGYKLELNPKQIHLFDSKTK